ncbi:RER1A-like protein [Tanacetum coccineum]
MQVPDLCLEQEQTLGFIPMSFISLGSFLSPLVYPKFKADRPMLPVKGSDEFRPFIRELSEFTFWVGPGVSGARDLVGARDSKVNYADRATRMCDARRKLEFS